MLQNNIEIAISKSEEYGWPLLEELNINDIITWIKRNWKAIRGTSSNKLERALNIFSFLFHEDLNDNGSSSDLFFCLAGIEALLVEGRDNIQEQVKSKSQLILGENLNFKKKINELYDLRSRYIHGNLDITNKYLHDEIWGDDRPGPNKTLDIVMRIYESSGFGIAIFIALIQKHIKMKKKEFEFEYVLKK